MKTTKLVMIAALVSFALMSFAKTELGMSKNVISLKEAIHNAELVTAIHSQVNPADFLGRDQVGSYTVQLLVNKNIYLVTGTKSEWRNFFYAEADVKPFCKVDFKPVLLSEKNPFGNAGKLINPFGKKGKKSKRPVVYKPK